MFFELRFRSMAKFVCSFNNVVRYVIDSGKKGKIQRESKKMAKAWQGKCKEQGEEKERKESEEMRK